MKVLVTGASGFIGQNLVARLLADGREVRAVYRRDSPDGLLALAQEYPGQLELRRLDLSFPDSMPEQSLIQSWFKAAKRQIPDLVPEWPLADADLRVVDELIQGCNRIVHIAARVGDWGTWRDFFAANVNPTRLLLAAARRQSLKRFVYVSSLAVHGFGHSRGNTEKGTYFTVGNPYQLSKRCGESLVRSAGIDGLPYSVIRPGNVYGPGDTTTFYPIFDALRKGIMGTLAGGRYLTCPVYIDDQVAAIAASLSDYPEPDHTFNITADERISWRQVIDLSREALGLKPSRLNLPGFLARLAAWVLESAFKLVHSKSAPPLTMYRVEQLLHDYDFSVQAATRSLGYRPQVDFMKGIKACAAAYATERKL